MNFLGNKTFFAAMVILLGATIAINLTFPNIHGFWLALGYGVAACGIIYSLITRKTGN